MGVVFPSLPSSIWGVVANVVLERPYGPGGVERRRGTKHFSPGAKVYVFQRIGWSDWRRIRVLGRHRRSGRLIGLTTGVELLANWRVEAVYSPSVIRRLLADVTTSPERIAEFRAALAAGQVHPAMEGIYRRIVDGAEEGVAVTYARAAGEDGRREAEQFVEWISTHGAGSQPFVTRPPSAEPGAAPDPAGIEAFWCSQLPARAELVSWGIRRRRAPRVEVEEHRLLAVWACECAERVLPHFEAERPSDDRPRRAIEAGRAWVRGELRMTDARKAAFAAHAAAREAGRPEAVAAARAAGHAAATAHVATHARHAANYAVAAAEDEAAERTWQTEQLPERLRSVMAGQQA